MKRTIFRSSRFGFRKNVGLGKGGLSERGCCGNGINERCFDCLRGIHRNGEQGAERAAGYPGGDQGVHQADGEGDGIFPEFRRQGAKDEQDLQSGRTLCR